MYISARQLWKYVILIGIPYMINKSIMLFIALATSATSISCMAESTGKGKIIYTQGHMSPACRTVSHKTNDTGLVKYFRIAAVAGDDDIQSVVLAALMADRDVDIFYDPAQTTGCGTEPAIVFATVF
ncbi:MAG: hypothetical protein ACI9FJ_000989 [Alteromonadaceae bacterium]